MTFEESWMKYITPLAGKDISLYSGSTNKIISVSKNGIKRISSRDKENFITIEPFDFAYNSVLSKGFMAAKEIEDKFSNRCSSGVIAILKEIPFIEFTSSPKRGIMLKK